MKDSFEAVQFEYMKMKFRAIHKLYQGIPLSGIEQKLLKTAEESDNKAFELNPELGKEYESKAQKYNRTLSSCKEKGEKAFLVYLQEKPGQYASIYTELGIRSYHGNTSRVTSSLLESMIKECGQDVRSLQVFDMASGPRTLQRHSLPELASRVIGLDINPDHFKEPGTNAIVGSYLNTPIKSNSMDYLVLGFAFDYTNFAPTKQLFERLKLLAEVNRVLKTGGRAVISLAYSTEMKDMNLFKEAIKLIGFKVVDGYTGHAKCGCYGANFITIEKENDIGYKGNEADMESLISKFDKEKFQGLKFNKRKKFKALAKDRQQARLRDMVENFELNGRNYGIQFNEADQRVKDEETEFYRKVDELMKKYNCENVKDIPKEALIEAGLSRYNIKDETYRIYKKLTTTTGIIKT
jgi:ubiquinone/menaquinone biosynthesis C-methylase UbiE